MAMDEDILKTLKAIEKLLGGASATTAGKAPTSADRSQSTKSQQAIRDGLKVFRATATRADETNAALLGVTKSLDILDGQVGKTTISFASLTSSMTKFMASLTPVDAPPGATTAGPATVASTADMAGFFKELTKEIADTRREIVDGVQHAVKIGNLSNDYLRIIAGSTSIGGAAQVAAMPTVNQQAAQIVGQIGQGVQKGITPTTKSLQQLQVPLSSVINGMIQGFGQTTTIFAGLETVGQNLMKVLAKLTGDFFALSRVGMGSTSNLIELSKNALLAGMSLKDYMEVIKTNITVASRAGSLDNFNKIISAADGQLAAMGIFGAEAKQLQGSLAQSSTMMGVSQANLTDAIAGQVDVFDKLRKSTNMTAQEFAGLVDDLSKNEQVQKELVALAPVQRANRRAEMLQIATTGERLGLAAEASKSLADALIAQRGETVSGRFEQAGNIRQLSQLLGMGAEGERAAQIGMKGQGASASETEELRKILGKIDTAKQGAYQSGSLGVQSALDHFTSDKLGGFGKIMQANRPAEIATGTGEVNNKDFGLHVGKFGQFVGNLTALIEGFKQSVGPGLVAAVGGGLMVLFRGPLLSLLTSVVGKFIPGVGGAVTAGASAAATTGASFGNVLSKLVAPLANAKNAVTALIPSMYDVGLASGKAVGQIAQVPTMLRQAWNAVQLTNAISGPLNTVKFIFQDFGASIGRGAVGLGTGAADIITGMAKFAGGFVLTGGLINAAIEMVTGEVAGALNPSGGFFNRIGGMVTAFFTAIPNMFIDLLGFVFGEEMFVGRLRNSFDTVVSFFNFAIKDFLSHIVGDIGSLFKWMLPKDSKFAQMIEDAGKSLEASATENAVTTEALWNDNTKTLKSISKDNAKASADAEKKATDATTKAVAAQSKFNDVQYGMDVSRASTIQDAQAILGTPQVQVPQAVKPGTVNTDENKAAAKTAEQAAEPGLTAQADMMVVLQSMLQVLRDSLTQEQKQAELAEQLLRSNRPAAYFVPAEVTANRFLA